MSDEPRFDVFTTPVGELVYPTQKRAVHLIHRKLELAGDLACLFPTLRKGHLCVAWRCGYERIPPLKGRRGLISPENWEVRSSRIRADEYSGWEGDAI